MSWLPGQVTDLHDHGAASGAFTIVSGELTEHVRAPRHDPARRRRAVPRVRAGLRARGPQRGPGPGGQRPRLPRGADHAELPGAVAGLLTVRSRARAHVRGHGRARGQLGAGQRLAPGLAQRQHPGPRRSRCAPAPGRRRPRRAGRCGSSPRPRRDPAPARRSWPAPACVGSRAWSHEPGARWFVITASAASFSSRPVSCRATPCDRGGPVVHRVVEHRAAVDDPVEQRDVHADRAARSPPRAGSPRRSSRAGRACRRRGRSRSGGPPARRRAPGTNARWQISPASSTACSADRSVIARSLPRRIVLRGVGESVRGVTPSSVTGTVASWKGHDLPILEGHFMAETPALPVTLDRASATPLAVQLAEQLRSAAGDGRLRSGDRLPSTRALATELGVSRTVTAAAYEQLHAEGWIAGRHGSGTYVTTEPPGALRTGTRPVRRDAPADTALDLTPGSPWAGGIDTAAWRRAWRAAAHVAPMVRPNRAGLRELPRDASPSTCCATAACASTRCPDRTVTRRCWPRPARATPPPSWPTRCCGPVTSWPWRSPATSVRSAPCGRPGCGWCRRRWTRTACWSTRCRPPRRPSTARPPTSTRSAAG